MNYIDAHNHLADPRFDSYRKQVLSRAQEAGISYFLQGGVGPDDWERQLALQLPGLFPCFGLHPWWVAEHEDAQCEQAFGKLERAIPKAWALGELGLDFYPKFDPSGFDRQRRWFVAQIHLAGKHHKPMILHLVKSHGDALALLAKEMAPTSKGLVHAFTRSYDIAKGFLDLGFLLSIGSAAAKPGYRKLKNAIKSVPLERIVIESDAPDLPPPDWPYPSNEPASIWVVAAAVGALKGLSAAHVLQQSRENLKHYFELELPE